MRPPLLYVGLLVYLSLSCQSKSDSIAPGSGVGGSTARFTISGNTLYTVSDTALQTYDISNSSNPQKGSSTKLKLGVETIFPYQTNLFIGTQTGMYIYDIAQPNTPKYVSLYTHILGCDPVVVQGKYAFVTLHSGTTCRTNAANVNRLEVIDISNLASPKLVGSYPMTNPQGLGIDGSLLFVGEGDFGLRIVDSSDPTQLKFLQSFPAAKTYDVIPSQKRLIITGPSGIFQYSYADADRLELLSHIPLTQ